MASGFYFCIVSKFSVYFAWRALSQSSFSSPGPAEPCSDPGSCAFAEGGMWMDASSALTLRAAHGFCVPFWQSSAPGARVLGAEQGIAGFPKAWAPWLQSHSGPWVPAEARKCPWLALGLGRLIHSAGESWSLLQRLSGKGAGWARSLTGMHQNTGVRVISMGSQAH